MGMKRVWWDRLEMGLDGVKLVFILGGMVKKKVGVRIL